MADLALGSLTASTTIAGTDLLYAVIGGNSRKITLANFLTSPTLVTPALGVATATSVAIGGATIGTDALAVTGSATFSANLTSKGLPLTTNSVAPTAAGIASLGASDVSIYCGGNRNFAFSTGSLVFLASSCKVALQNNTNPIITMGASEDAALSRNTAGVLQFGTSSTPNASGSWLATSAGLGATPVLSSSTFLRISAGTTAASQIRFIASTAPTSPVDGDYWFDGTNVKIQVSGATKTFTLI